MKLITRILRATTLQRQLSIAFAIGMLMLALAGSLLSSVQSTRLIRQLLEKQGTLASETLAQGAQLALIYNASDNAATALRLALSFQDVTYVEIRTVDGKLLVGANRSGAPLGPDAARPVKGAVPFIEHETDEAWSFVAPVLVERNPETPFDIGSVGNEPLGYVRIVQSKATLHQMRAEVFRTNLAISLFFALVFLWLIRFLTGRLAGPLARLSDAMARAQRGEPDVQADTTRGTRDIATMAHAFNAMMDALWRRENQVLQLNRELECKVGERTAQLGEATRQAQAANRAKSTFLANMSHEIRTPLNAVLGYAQLLEHDPQLPAALRASVTPIAKAGHHLLHLISDILDLSKIEAGQMTLQASRFDLDNLIDEVAVMFVLRCQQKGLRWHCDKRLPAPCMVEGDAGKLRQVLINLLGNAVKFTAHGSVTLAVAECAGGIAFTVSDTGPGIAQHEQTLVFEPFRQTDTGSRQGGTGLGLAISARQTELMGGRLALQSVPGHGAHFSFTLPLACAAGSVAAPGAAPIDFTMPLALAPECRPTLLVVDDNPENRDILDRMLTRLGATVLQAADGALALQQLRAHAVDLVFMDIRMPGMDGMQALRQLRAEFGAAAPKCVAITASVLAHETALYLAQGFDDFIAKPFLFAQICVCLQRLLDVRYVAARGEDRGDSGAGANGAAAGPMAMPQRWHREMTFALATGWVTGVTSALQELQQAQPHAHAFVAHLERLLAEFDMDAISTALTEVKHE